VFPTDQVSRRTLVVVHAGIPLERDTTNLQLHEPKRIIVKQFLVSFPKWIPIGDPGAIAHRAQSISSSLLNT
jgi:hypothetical protein